MFSTLTLLAHEGHWHSGFPFFPLIFLALWAAIIVVVARRWRNPRRSAEAVLWERYARGEIDEAEVHAKRAVMRKS